MGDLDQKKADVLRNNPETMRGHVLDAPTFHVNPDVKLPEWVKCKKCGKGPTGYNWLKPVSPDPNCRVLIHLDCIEEGLSRKFENQMGGHGQWPG